VKTVSVALLLALGALHWIAGERGIHQPLSMFRDGAHAWLGYLPFALLVVVGAIMARDSFRCGECGVCAFYSQAVILLIVIAATPSWDSVHVLPPLGPPVNGGKTGLRFSTNLE